MTVTTSVILIGFSGGLLNGMTGFGALIVMVPLLVLFLDMNVAVPLGVLCGIMLQLSGTLAYRTHIDKKRLLHMFIGGLPGIWLGSALLYHLPELWLRAALGALILFYVGWSVFFGRFRPPTHPPATVWAYVAGFFSGAFGGAFGIIGPPAVIYVTRTGWSPDAIRGFLGAFFLLLFVAIALMQVFQGVIGADAWALAAWTVPFCLAGSVIGRRLSNRLAPKNYMRMVFILLFAMGLSLCWPAASAFFSGALAPLPS